MGLTGFKAANHPQQTSARGARDDIDDRGTDPALFGHIISVLGTFSIDVAASRCNAKVERWYNRVDDGLQQSWAGERVWCNPPYSDLNAWVEKAWAEWETATPRPQLIVMLVPSSRTEQAWWQNNVEPMRDLSTSHLRVVFLRGRRRFVKAGADAIGPNERPPFGSCLLVWREAGLTVTERRRLAEPVSASCGPEAREATS